MGKNSGRELELPFDAEAEEGLVGAILIDPDVLIENEIDTDDFYLRQLAQIVDAAQTLSRRGVVPDLITLAEELTRRGQLADLGGPARLTDLINATPSSMHAVYYADIVREKATYRRIIAAAQEMVIAAYAQEKKPEEIVAEADRALVDTSPAGGVVEAGQVMDGIYDDLERLRNNPRTITGIPTGLTDLDRQTGGLQRGDLVIIAARPSMGKTALALQLAAHAAQLFHAKTLFLSLEMKAKVLMQRVISPQVRVTVDDMRCGRVNDEQYAAIMEAGSKLRGCGLWIGDNGQLNPAKLRAVAMTHQARHGLDLLVIDYLQLMTSGQRAENRTQEISQITRACKLLAGELNIPVVLLSQLSRALETRADKRPMLSDLRESGAIEQDADQVWFIYREVVYNPDTENPGLCEVNVAKYRNGPTGVVNLFFQKQFTQFASTVIESQSLNWQG